ncbi:Leucine rich repeat/Leucine Rich Repeat [Novymonas esmeraldas]|uniref:Leucine rich repeat/Leucine Rich Repeat n=1 Tax=Novymonas esmeraldas TaxID=1808958 RepID=A0AAW0F3J3_9TRYP
MASPPPARHPPPPSSVVYGPRTTTTVTTTVVGDDANGRPTSRTITAAGERLPSPAPAPPAPPAAPQRRPPALRHAAASDDDAPAADLRALRQTRSLFLCGRGLLSLRHIEHLPEMTALRSLSVHMNNIKTLEGGCLRTLRHLVELDLSANELREVPAGCWDGLGRLERLNLSSNQLTHLGPTAFASLVALRWLSIGFNGLRDVSGLRSIPAAASLSYVDLCANHIKTVDEVMDALAPHRAHLQELRLLSPSATMQLAGADTMADGATPEDGEGDVSVGPSWPIEENPCCSGGGSDSSPAARGTRAVARGGGRGGRRATPSAESTGCVERLLAHFPRLLVVNGVAYGVDPLHALRQQRQELECAGDDVVVKDEPPPAPPLQITGDVDTPAADDPSCSSSAFAELLSRPLPRLPRLSPSSSSSSPSASSTPSREGGRRHGSRHRRRGGSRHGSHRRHAASASRSPPRDSSRHHRRRSTEPERGASAAVVVATAAPPQQDQLEPPPPPPLLQSTSGDCRADGALAGLLHAPHGRRTPAAKPRRASLRRRVSASTTTSSSSASPPVPSAATSPFSDATAAAATPRAVPPPAMERARRLRFDASAATASPDTPSSRSAGGGRAVADEVSSPDGVIDARSTPPHGAATVDDRRSAGAGDTALSAAPLPAPPPPLRWRPKQVSRGTCTEAVPGPAAAAAVEALLPPPPPPLQEAQLAAQVEQLQTELALRTATLGDLRQHLDLTRAQYMETQREAQQRQQQLRSQVAALKDELARRAEETAIVQRKQQAQLNRAVEAVKAEWSQRREEVDRHSAEAAAEWEARLARAEEETLSLQQTCTVRAAQVATLERQTAAMAAEMRAMRERAAVQSRDWSARTALLLAEANARRSVEAAAAATCALLSRTLASSVARLHSEALAEACRCRDAAEAALRAQQLAWATQMAAYDEALRHAAREGYHATPTPSAAAPEVSALSDPHSSRPLASAGADVSALVHSPVAAPLCAPPDNERTETAALDAVAAQAVVTLATGADATGAVSAYWREACAVVEARLGRVEAALQVATGTQQSMAAENTRLLRQVEALQAERQTVEAAHESASTVTAQERENLLRTVRTLRAEMERKDAALDALESEAHSKLAEKRHRIAALEAALEELTTQHTRATETSATTRAQLEEAQAAVEALRRELAESQERCTAAAQQQAEQLPNLERKHRELAELLATRNAEAHQHELERKTLVHTLTVAREQLVRLHEAYQHLSRAEASTREHSARLEAELSATRQHVRDVQESTRAKQKATFEMLSHLMTSDSL